MARKAISEACLVDASVLYTLTLIPEVSSVLVSLVAKPSITDVALRDLLSSEDILGMPSDGSFEYDGQHDRVSGHGIDGTQRSRQHAQIRDMLKMGREMRRVLHPEILHIRPIGSADESVWALNLDAARHNGIPLWADDVGLRAVARQMGIETFGTQSMLEIARERGRVDAVAMGRAIKEFARERVVDFPYEESVLLEVATEQVWQARSVAVILRRPYTWNDVERAIRLFKTTFRNSPDDNLVAWSCAALTGLQMSVHPERRSEMITAFAALILGDVWTRPEQARAFVDAIAIVESDHLDDVVQGALKQVWSKFCEVYENEVAVLVFLHVIRHLSDPHRQYAARLILE